MPAILGPLASMLTLGTRSPHVRFGANSANTNGPLQPLTADTVTFSGSSSDAPDPEQSTYAEALDNLKENARRHSSSVTHAFATAQDPGVEALQGVRIKDGDLPGVARSLVDSSTEQMAVAASAMDDHIQGIIDNAIKNGASHEEVEQLKGYLVLMQKDRAGTFKMLADTLNDAASPGALRAMDARTQDKRDGVSPLKKNLTEIPPYLKDDE